MKPIKRIEGRGQRASRAKDPVTKDGNTVLARDVIESLPYGVVIVDDRGRVLASNRLLSEMLGAEPDRVPLTCCELFGCRQPGTSLQEGCLTEFAQAANGRLSEVLVELPWGGSVGTVWVSVSPLGGVTRCMFHVRPGERRSDQSAPPVDPGQHLRVYTLGRFRLEGAQGPMAGPWLEQRPGQLLKLLCAERHRVVYLEEIAESLWPERGFEALGFVRHFVHVLRNRLEPERARGASSFVLARPGGYAIDRRRVRIDADEFERNLDKARLALSAGDPAGAIGRLERALKLYKGEFLADEPYAEWALAERSRLRVTAEGALRTLSDILWNEKDLDGATNALHRLADLQPLDSDVQRALITAYIKRGRRTEAKRRYGELRKRLHREFGEEPDFQLADLAG